MPFQVAGRLADPHRPSPGQACPVARTLSVFGSRAAMVLLREAAYGTTRFDDFAHRAGLTESVTAARLKELVAAGLLERRPYREPGQRERQEYVLTEAGDDALPVLLALTAWGQRHLPRGAGLDVTHAGCGEPVEVVPTCAAGHRVDVHDVAVAPRSR